MAGFPESIEAVYVGGGLWLRVRVLDLPVALTGKDAIRVAVSAAKTAMEPDQPPREGQPMDESTYVHRLAKHAKAVTGVARQAVIGHAWSAADEEADQAHAAAVAAVHERAAEGYRQAAEAHAAALGGAGEDPQAVATASEALTREVARIDAETAEALAAIQPPARGPAPTNWQPITIVPNPQDEDRARGKYAVVTLDLVAADWCYRVSDVALRVVWEARAAVRPLSRSGRP